ncbi:hypothetical protein [Phyllobacterium meliloti]|nr:hypothetical protein [Phyllobacterium sp. T1293]UGX86910.1 hypothetical protein LLE53_003380 [Phyllobacterium sp. T1293]
MGDEREQHSATPAIIVSAPLSLILILSKGLMVSLSNHEPRPPYYTV